MEDLTLVLLVLGIYIPSFVGVMYAIKRPNTGKKKVQESSSDSVGEMFDTSSRGYKDIIKVKDNQIRSLAAKLKLNEDEIQDESIMEHVPSWEEIKELAKTQGINPLALEVPFIKKQVKSITKGMTIQEITQNVAELKKLMGGKGFKFGNKEDDKSESIPIGEIKLDTTNFS